MRYELIWVNFYTWVQNRRGANKQGVGKTKLFVRSFHKKEWNYLIRRYESIVYYDKVVTIAIICEVEIYLSKFLLLSP